MEDWQSKVNILAGSFAESFIILSVTSSFWITVLKIEESKEVDEGAAVEG